VGIFEQAGFALRFGSFMFDLLLVMLLFLISALLGSSLPAFAEAARLGGFAAAAVFCLFNFILLPARRGQTLGKRLFGLRAVRESGLRLTLGQSFLRQLPLFGLALSNPGRPGARDRCSIRTQNCSARQTC
jgi:uncharacterized RDD family membrane protein YckC